MVVHGFANRSDADLRYLNFHAPGLGFADYLRGLVAGRTVACDQEPPPAEGVRPATDAVIGGPGWTSRRSGSPRAGSSRRVWTSTTRSRRSTCWTGRWRLKLDGREVSAPEGSWVQVAAGVAHAVTGSARCLNIRTPNFG